MKRTVGIVILMGFIGLGWGGEPVWAEDAAMVTDLSGGPARYSGGEKNDRALGLMDFLAEGDRITLDPGAVLVIHYFTSGKRERLTGPGSLVVTPDQSLVEGLKVETSQSTLPVPAAMVGSDTQHVGATALKSMTPPSSGRMASSVPNLRGDDLFGEEPASGPLADRREAFKNQCLGEGRILPLNLFKTAVLDPSPPRWVPVPKAARYRLVLKDDKGKKMASRETKNPSCPLTGWTFQDERWYSWTVDALTAKGRVVASGGGTFLRLGPDRRKALAEAELKIRFKTTPGSAEERIQLALVHQEFGLYDQAADTLRPLAVQNPGAGGLTRRMNLLDPSRMVTAALPTL